MEFGFNIPNGGPLAHNDDIAAICRKGEDCGYSILAIPDHIIIPRTIGANYPYSPDGTLNFSTLGAGECLEPLALMASAAAQTKTAKLLTSVMVVPYREPMLTAKLVSTIDHLSGGRTILGCGAGWMPEEFVAVGAPPYEERGKVTDEYIDIYRELWTKDAPSFKGKYRSFSNIYFAPKPKQQPHPPIWIGGESAPAMRRAVKRGDAWYPIGCNPHAPLDSLKRYKAALEVLKRMAAEEKRDFKTLDLAYWSVWTSGTGAPVKASDGERMLLTGSADDIAGDLAAMKALGVNHVLFNFLAATRQETLDRIEAFAKTVLAKVR
ncbi:MAG: TIGR03619 family F420-dependent LLM class oxidoreductase [Alphaproteobacteria bacterium]|nr:TIGR03619 family F420-dependent LLM class oxidoreductase [Alphaproteobacteria bacterium]